jgi:hypothetical protein
LKRPGEAAGAHYARTVGESLPAVAVFSL